MLRMSRHSFLTLANFVTFFIARDEVRVRMDRIVSNIFNVAGDTIIYSYSSRQSSQCENVRDV